MTTEREAFEAQLANAPKPFKNTAEAMRWAWQAACAWQREKDAEKSGEFAREWWGKHCATNKHMETTRAAHEAFCALQNKIRSAE